ncbi:LysR family transcriptional regulator [Marinilabilia rubra]|uniref:LysR family transcriptional regulator n=1 Tax=Marinilabilia rubra TaxID=2162893 RepID=A0A2U2B4Z9_9BACT|nr:LysR family transcriptional regulator [Marinilabilia rubra]PWD98148.1 LysR family transcriptional regulator [Marinilabilia rubra]
MNYRDEVFLQVAELLNISKAAERLFISQPAVTKHIQEMENKLDMPLFERKGNRIYLTRAGKITFNHLKSIKQQYQELEFELNQINNTYKGNLRIGASSTITQYVIPPVIAAFHARYPDIKLSLLNGNSEDMTHKLLNNEIDLVLVENQGTHQNIHYIDFMDDEIFAVTNPESLYARRRQVTNEELPQTPMVLRETGSGTLEVIKKAFSTNNMRFDEMNIILQLGSTEAIKNFLSDFEGISFISEKAVKKEINRKELVKIKTPSLSITRRFRIGLRQGPEMKLTRLFTDYLINYNF